MATLAYLAPSLALLCIGHLLSAQASLPLQQLPDREADDVYSVYSALIKKALGSRSSLKILILDHTNGGPSASMSCVKPPEGEEAGRYEDQIRSFVERNKSRYGLVAKFNLGRSYELVSDTPRLVVGSGAAHFSFSAVGFNAARDRAVVYMSQTGVMGGVRFLTKLHGTWTVDLQRMPFVCGWIV
jgi:hypothetical protein